MSNSVSSPLPVVLIRLLYRTLINEIIQKKCVETASVRALLARIVVVRL